METTLSVLGIAGVIALGAMSPGPSFVLAARTAVAGARSDGLAVALGLGVGGVMLAVAALLGLHLLLNAVPVLNLGLKLLGGGYLMCLGVLIWRSARQPLPLPGTDTGRAARPLLRSFWLGLFTQVSNPKAVVVYASIFAALLPTQVPDFVTLLLPLLIFAVEAGWYGAVAMTLSTPSPRALYLRAKVWIDRATGGVLLLLGGRLLAGAWQAWGH